MYILDEIRRVSDIKCAVLVVLVVAYTCTSTTQILVVTSYRGVAKSSCISGRGGCGHSCCQSGTEAFTVSYKVILRCNYEILPSLQERLGCHICVVFAGSKCHIMCVVFRIRSKCLVYNETVHY